MADVTTTSLTKRFGSLKVFEDLNIHIRHMEFVSLLGPSGCGKSTLLRCIAGLEDPTSGQILIDGVDVTNIAPSKRGAAMVFQSYALYPHKTVAENMGFALKIQGVPANAIEKKVAEAAKALRIGELLGKRPRELSGGQRQRVAIGRAIVRNPKVFLFDEPLSNLDAALRAEMRVELAALHHRLEATMIYVTHDQVEAMTMADRIVIMQGGSVQQIGTPMDVYLNPANEFVAGFIGAPKMNMFDVRGAGDGATIPGIGVLKPARINEMSQIRRIGFRPDELIVGEIGIHQFKLRVSVVERLGAQTLIHGRPDTDGGDKLERQIVAVVPGNADIIFGDRVPLSIPADAIYAFDADGKTITGERH